MMTSVMSSGFSPSGDGVGRLDEIVDMPLLDEVIAVEAGVDEDVVAVAADQPDHHGDVEFARGVGAFDQIGDGEAGHRGVADGVDLVLRFRLGDQGSDRERGDEERQENAIETMKNPSAL